jgi:hypothetical protein
VEQDTAVFEEAVHYCVKTHRILCKGHSGKGRDLVLLSEFTGLPSDLEDRVGDAVARLQTFKGLSDADNLLNTLHGMRGSLQALGARP